MKKVFVLFFLILSSLVMWAQDIEVSASVVAGDTGELLPYVHITAGNGKNTMTNVDGNFTIKVGADNILTLSCVGFESLKVSASKVSKVLKMEPMTRMLNEVRAIPWETILMNTSKKLNKEITKKKYATSKYFCRMTTSYVKKELFEVFLEAKSVSNLKDIEFLSGRRGKMTIEGLMNSSISSMNFHHSFEVGVLQRAFTFWSELVTPFTERLEGASNVRYMWSYMGRKDSGYKPESDMWHYVWTLKNFYNIDGEELAGSDGQKVYKVTFTKKSAKIKNTILTGTMYVDAKTLDLLKFDGQIENMNLEVMHDFYRQNENLKAKVLINYRHDKGYTEVASIATSLRSNRMYNQAIIYNVDDLDLHSDGKSSNKKKQKGRRVTENMLATVDAAGFDEMLWANNNIVQRTDEEEALAGMPNQTALASELLKLPETKMERLVDRLEHFGRNIPQEKVYLHMDNTCYFLGDTIWFSAFTRQTSDGKPSQISGVLYVELFNQEGFLVERKLVEMTNGRGYGNFVLDTEHNYGGYYELRAYTRWQLNWGLTQAESSTIAERWFLSKDLMWNYFRDYDKLYSRVFPVYDKPSKPGDYAEIMTERRMRRLYSKDPHKRKLQLSLFPEGGNLVEGLPCRVAFEARWDDGQEVEGELKLVNEVKKANEQSKSKVKSKSDDGEVEIKGIKTENRGRGVFDITPVGGEDRNVVLTTKDGATIKAKLPKPIKEGVSLRVYNEDSTLNICVISSETLPTDSLGVTIMHEGVLEKFVQITDHRQMISVPVSELRTGVNQVTVFDVNGQVLADRLTFVRGDDNVIANLTIKGKKDYYKPYESVELDIQGVANSQSISLSVKDASHRDVLFDNASMLTEMLLTSEIKGFVENPEWFFARNDYAHNRALDLLMMTQGWRRFSWQDMAVDNSWQLVHSAERTPVITGRVYDISEDYYEDMIKMQQHDAEAESAFNSMMESTEGLGNPILPESSNSLEPYSLSSEPEVSPFAGFNDTHWQSNVSEILSSKSVDSWSLSELEYYPGRKNVFKKKKVRLHAELVDPNNKKYGKMDIDLNDGYFKIQLPSYYGDAIFFLSAADTMKWKGNKYEWIKLATDDEELLPAGEKMKYRVLPAEFSVRVNFPYPRFVKPYDYYQTHLNYSYDPLLSTKVLADGSLPLDEVKVWAKHGGLQSFEDSVPTLIVDGYDAYNQTLDAGFIRSSWWFIARNMVDDYGLARPYVVQGFNNYDNYHFRKQYGYDILRRSLNDLSTNPDSAYMRRNLKSVVYPLSNETKKWELHSYIDKYVLYTDYQPRLRGDERYAINLPRTDLAVYPDPEDSRRAFYRDRRYILPGFSFVNEFYNPDYSNLRLDEAPKDYRRTLYWNPMLRLDNNGNAKVKFYNNSTQHQITIDAQGMSWDGAIYKSEVEQ